MNEGLDFLFNYLKKEHISVDTDEFYFQFKSHPDYPSLLAISDTLTFFNVSNGALQVTASEINILPETYVALLRKDTAQFLALVERKGDKFTYTEGTAKKITTTSEEELTAMWGNVVLLVEKDAGTTPKKSGKNLRFLRTIPFLILLGFVLYSTFSNLQTLLFYLFPLAGIFLSLAILKDLFGVKGNFLSQFCNLSAQTSCEAVVNSTDWGLFKKISFSDMSIMFFATQILALLIAGFATTVADYFTIQLVLLALSVPVILLSLYYQKWVVKKWCPICLSIAAVLLAELVYVFYFYSWQPPQLSGLISYFFAYAAVLLVWYPLKKLLIYQKELKEEQLKANRFKRNYSLFKNALLSKPRYQLPENPITLGNKNGRLQIGIITNPYCRFCAEAHQVIDEMVQKYGEDISVSVLFKTNPRAENEELNLLLYNLMTLQLKKGDEHFNEALGNWFKEKNHQKWLQKYGTEVNRTEMAALLHLQNKWCHENNLNFTPCIFIQGYLYPDAYTIKDIRFFIDELRDDTAL